jgi:hypothetical protein
MKPNVVESKYQKSIGIADYGVGWGQKGKGAGGRRGIGSGAGGKAPVYRSRRQIIHNCYHYLTKDAPEEELASGWRRFCFMKMVAILFFQRGRGLVTRRGSHLILAFSRIFE